MRALADGLLVFGLAYMIYLLSAPRGIVLDDDGYFVLAAWFNGVAHAPGYPLYTALAHLATFLPFGSVAFRVHAASALFAALACVCLGALAGRMNLGRAFAATGALCYAVSGAFWSQAIVAEVYSLNALFFFGLLLLALRAAASVTAGPAETRTFAFLYGLSLTNHWPLMVLSAPALLAALWPVRRDFASRLPSVVIFGILGLTPYLWMVFRSWNSEIAFHGPIETPGDFWFYVSREEYRLIDAAPGAGWEDRLHFAVFALSEASVQFGILGAPFVALGFLRQWHAWPRHVSWALALGFLGSTLVLIALLGFAYDLRYRNVFGAYPLVAWGIAALWLALGLQWAVERARVLLARRARALLLNWGAAAILIGSAFAWNAPQNWRAADTWARDYGLAVLEALPAGASLFVFGDYATGPVAYLNLIERHRPDVTLYSVKGQLFDDRLFPAHGVDPRRRFDAIDRFIRTAAGPVLYTPALPHRYGAIDYGMFYEVAPALPPSTLGAALDPRIRFFLETTLDRGLPADPSQLLHYRGLTLQYCRLIATLFERGSTGSEPLADALESRCAGYQGLLARAEAALRAGRADPSHALALLDRAAIQSEQAVTRDNSAALDYLRGRAFAQAGDREKAASYFAASVALWPATENPAWRFLSVPDGVDGGGDGQ